MVLILQIILAALLGAFAWRVRGGAWETLLGFPASTQGARAACALALSLPVALGDPTALLLAPALFLGMVLAGWGKVMDIGRVSGNRLTETVAMSAWGLIAVFPAIGAVAWTGGEPLALVAAGMAMGPLYALCWWLQGRLANVPGFAAGPTEWAEAAVGSVLGGALVLSWQGNF